MSQDQKQGDAPRPSKPLTYREAGVDIDAQDEALDRIKRLVAGTRTSGVLSELGSFGGLFRPDLGGLEDPILVASSDGVGTKLCLAFETGIHDTVGRDLVNHCVNDILVQGARPLFFMDYVATGRLEPSVLASVVEGIAAGCRDNGCALLGGETAEMPGFYGDGEYDVAGFVVGMVDRPRLIDGSGIVPGDRLIGLPSTGLHTNGYSLARKALFEVGGYRVDQHLDELGTTVGQALLAEHRSYLPPLSGPVDEGRIAGLAHITGGGLTDNLPRILPAGSAARIERARIDSLPIFELIRRLGNVADDEMFRTFNMGIGMVAVVHADEQQAFERHLDQQGQRHVTIGEIVEGDGTVIYA